MNTAIEMSMPVWKTPDSYFGFDPVGDYVLYSRHRDSDFLTESNWEMLQQELQKIIDTIPIPNTRTQINHWGEEEELPSDWMYIWSAGHWAVGWVEYLMIRRDAPEELLERANDLHHYLKHEYPILDEDDYMERQDEAIYQWWKDCTLEERIDYCRKTDDSIFAARRDDEMPPDVYDYLRDSDMFN